MSKNFLEFNKVSFGYESAVENLFENITFRLHKGWTGVIGPNGSGKTTLLKLACGDLFNYSGSIQQPFAKVYCEQRTDLAPKKLEEFFNDHSKIAYKLIDSFKLSSGWMKRWQSLSHGERKRLQLALALWESPELLAIDEPTNHLDVEAKEIIINSLLSYKGVGIIVSHDRDVLDNLCGRILFIEPPKVTMRQGNFTQASEQRLLENKHTLKAFEIKQKQYGKLQKEYKRRSELADKSKKKSSKRNIDRKDRDAKSKIDLGRLTGKDAVGGKLKNQITNRLEKAQSDLNSIEVKREYATGINLLGSESQRNFLLKLDAGEIDLSRNKKLFHNDLIIVPNDKIALTGVNGCGKSTLVKLIIDKLNIEKGKLTYIPQEISVDEIAEIIKEVKDLSNEDLGKLMIIISRLGSDAKRVLETDSPSPGETRKILLGLGITRSPNIIIMDEPTNHMDLLSIECLENALKEVSCSLLLVSHDKRFLESLTEKEWRIEQSGVDYNLIQL